MCRVRKFGGELKFLAKLCTQIGAPCPNYVDIGKRNHFIGREAKRLTALHEYPGKRAGDLSEPHH